MKNCTFFFHVDLKAFFEPAGLALIPSCHIYHTITIFFADVVQVPLRKKWYSKFGEIFKLSLKKCVSRWCGEYLHSGQSSDGSFEESSASVTRWDSIVLAAGFVTANFAQNVDFFTTGVAGRRASVHPTVKSATARRKSPAARCHWRVHCWVREMMIAISPF